VVRCGAGRFGEMPGMRCWIFVRTYTRSSCSFRVIADLALRGAADESVAASDSREACRQILAVLEGFPSAADKK
jgi:hypothetical protein